ncbi:hypothetical protein GOODEAATRI_028027 [Goodea atripinnis]|uniref:Uncharacterized protein n=1 Tax=Goodea atripinnis TaxID=208336 RepID=A0ABV0MVT2_9TELE
MKFLERKHNTSSAEKVLCIDSFGMSAVWQKKNSTLQGWLFELFYNYLKRHHDVDISVSIFQWDPTDYSTLYGIVNDNHHWFVIVSVCISSIKTQFLSNSFVLIKVLKSPSQVLNFSIQVSYIHVPLKQYKADS